jgi:hypothetical protein
MVMMPLRPVALAILIVAAASRPAPAAIGAASLTGTSRLAAKGCGADREPLVATVTVRDDGTWSAESPGDQFSGTYTSVGGTGRKLAFAFDAPTLTTLTGRIVEGVSGLCNVSGVVISSSRAKALTLTINRKLTRAKLLLRYVFAGSAGGRRGTATYTARAAGPWTPQ